MSAWLPTCLLTCLPICTVCRDAAVRVRVPPIYSGSLSPYVRSFCQAPGSVPVPGRGTAGRSRERRPSSPACCRDQPLSTGPGSQWS